MASDTEHLPVVVNCPDAYSTANEARIMTRTPRQIPFSAQSSSYFWCLRSVITWPVLRRKRPRIRNRTRHRPPIRPRQVRSIA